MEIQIRQMDPQSIHQVDQFNRNSVVNSKLVLHLEENRLSYSMVTVEPYEKILSIDAEDYTTFIDNPQKVIFFADVDGKPAGQIKIVPWWNKFAYIEELAVDTEFRGMGVGRALLTKAIEWAKQQSFPGITLETQDNNVPACRLYESCGFELRGFDTHAYKGLNPSTNEIALYWYLIF
ncbi:MAG: GNAT family N-acetyltransferase [Anaerolineae bacterium]|nr:GNAT family N-acetyltransferase [Anaerolineae bacterium]MCI0609179.1 GNAT family N-acetyltransferase [Anaerolineae bacterium]